MHDDGHRPGIASGGWAPPAGTPRRTAIRGLAAALVAAATLLTSGATGAAAQPLTVAAASDIQPVLPAIAAQFERETGQKVTLTFGSSGNFFAQIQNGAPFDVFMSADIDYPKQLERAGLTEPGSLYRYALGRIVVWTRNDSGVDIRSGLASLADPKVKRVAIANPEHAPYGRAAVAALRRESLYDRVQPKLVLGENISQAVQFAQTGNAEAGVIALSLALSAPLTESGTYVLVPESFHPPIEQAAIVVAASKQKPLARRFVELLKTPESVRLFSEYGFVVPSAAAR
jgi:molybdate transport system substrate-binding protein